MLPASLYGEGNSLLSIFQEAVWSNQYEVLSFAKFYLKVRFTAESMADPCCQYVFLLEDAVRSCNPHMFEFLLNTLEISADINPLWKALAQGISVVSEKPTRQLFWNALLPKLSSSSRSQIVDKWPDEFNEALD